MKRANHVRPKLFRFTAYFRSFTRLTPSCHLPTMADIVSRARIMSDEEKPSPTPPPLSTRPVPDPQPASESTKRPLARRTSSAKPTKRARASIGAHETVQVSNLARHRLDFADAECFYVKDFIDPQVAQAWHDELLTIDGCEPPPSFPSQSEADSTANPSFAASGYQPTLKMYGKEITQSRKIAGKSRRTRLLIYRARRSRDRRV